MSDTLFIQFYNKSIYKNKYYLDNGFSDTHDLCKSKGDFHWVEMDYPDMFWLTGKNDTEFRNICLNNKLPINKGTVYISITFVYQLYQAFIWAEIYPNINFKVGGAILYNIDINSLQFKYNSIPNNLELIYLSVEEYFNVPNYSYPWKLELPNKINDDNDISFNYTYNHWCYWGKCSFCSMERRLKSNNNRFRKIGFDLKDVSHKGLKTIRIGGPAISGDWLRSLDKLPIDKNVSYHVFVRTTKTETKIIKNIKRDLSDITFGIGVEFPSDRVLKIINKGTTVNEILNFLDMSVEKNFNVMVSNIIGWNFLINEDIEELKIFINKLKKYDNLMILVNSLLVCYNTPIYGKYDINKKSFCGPFYLGYTPKLNKEQQMFSEKSLELYKTCKEVYY